MNAGGHRRQTKPSCYRRCVDHIGAGLLLPVGFILWGGFFVVRKVAKGVRVVASGIDWAGESLHYHNLRHRVRHSRLPPSKPLASSGHTASQPSQNLGFLRLPLEIRLRIYELALPTKIIFQPAPGRSRMFSYRGPSPDHWRRLQYIRSDEESPSAALRTITALDGSFIHSIPTIPSRGCVMHGFVPKLICGDSVMFGFFLNQTIHCFHTDLLLTCRAVYRDMLDQLYGQNTISFFGPESVLYFARNASPEGLSRVRFAHLAIQIPSLDWNLSKCKKSVLNAIQCLSSTMSNLCQLDVEVVLTWSQPAEPQQFWAWLREVLAQIRGLDEFVLKVSALRPLSQPAHRRFGYKAWTPDFDQLISWDIDEYAALKDAVKQPKSDLGNRS